VDEVIEATTFGFPAEYAVEPIEVSLPRLRSQFGDGHWRYGDVWSRVLSEEAAAGVEDAARRLSEDGRGLVLEPELWFRIVYDYLVAHQAGQVDQGELLDSLIPLYYARTATFVEEARNDTDDEAEARVEEGVDVAVGLKPYLRERWPRVGAPLP
jgi:hypothetical protein